MQRHKRPGTDQEGEWAAPNEIRWFDSYRDRRDFARCCAGDLFARWTGRLASLKGGLVKSARNRLACVRVWGENTIRPAFLARHRL